MSYKVFGHENRSDLIKRGLKSYVIDNAANPLTPRESMSPDFQTAAHERHLNSSNSYIYNLLCKMEYGSPENPRVCASAVNLSTLFVSGIEAILMALETCGFPFPYKYVLPWQFFDGKRFHFLYKNAKKHPRNRILCNDEDEVIERFYQLLPVVTDNTEYDPIRFEWSNILKDFLV
ncbi:unnamed protein product [Larinioides sclopetarius]|uniref:Uncharacterized protein n=1 Tax=Larinioides sclopetarius TaxID=280406 RepID=A0AAV2B9E6_9ARAC